jgi:predicted Ser/Thr protein kinase
LRTTKNIDKEAINCFNIDLSTCKFLGQGANGKVYLLPNGKALKIFFKKENCKHEYEILKSVEGNKHFPKVNEYSSNCMIREYIGGILIENYIRKYGLSVILAKNLIELIEDFRKLGFTRLDIRCAHIFIQQDMTIKIIDPRKTYSKLVPYPYSILKTLNKLGVLDDFFNTLKNTNIKLYKDWSTRYIFDKKNHVHY